MLGLGLSQPTLGLGVLTMVIDASGGSSTIGAVQIKKKNSLDGPEDQIVFAIVKSWVLVDIVWP